MSDSNSNSNNSSSSSSTSIESIDDRFLTPTEVPVTWFDIQEAFDQLTATEQRYAYHVARASFAGSLICLVQTSPESPGIFNLLQALFSAVSPASLRELAKGNDLADQVDALINYAALFYANMSNFKSFGDTKFVPRVDAQGLRAIFALTDKADELNALLDLVADRMWSCEANESEIGLPGAGTNGYYSDNVTKEILEGVQAFMQANNLSAYNTRVFVNPKDASQVEIRLASSQVGEPWTGEQDGVTYTVTTGDYAPLMALVVEELKAAHGYAANENQKEMMDQYVISFMDGSIEAHKDAQRAWIKDKGPIIESNIGFIESYQDPMGVRGQFEGWVAMVNKETSKKFGALVASAEPFIASLPWPEAFEKEVFSRPDFTSLEVVAFAGTGIPAGINIPNYDDVRQNFGFKNVSLGNVISAPQTSDKPSTFLTQEDSDAFKKLHADSFTVQVAGHELLGHGSGRLLVEGEFDESTVDPRTGKPVATWYKAGETYDGVFGTISSSMEECRAECVGLVLSADDAFLKILDQAEEQWKDITYVNWLSMARAGVLALEYYTPESRKWGQAHMQARYAILRVLLDSGLVSINRDTPNGSYVQLDESKLREVGVPAVNEFLLKIHVAKCTADYAAAKALYDEMTSVGEDMLDLRKEVLARKQPRRIFMQPALVLQEGKEAVKVKQFDVSPDGVIDSMVYRFAGFDPVEGNWSYGV